MSKYEKVLLYSTCLSISSAPVILQECCISGMIWILFFSKQFLSIALEPLRGTHSEIVKMQAYDPIV